MMPANSYMLVLVLKTRLIVEDNYFFFVTFKQTIRKIIGTGHHTNTRSVNVAVSKLWISTYIWNATATASCMFLLTQQTT